jgi:hypothetical protein
VYGNTEQGVKSDFRESRSQNLFAIASVISVRVSTLLNLEEASSYKFIYSVFGRRPKNPCILLKTLVGAAGLEPATEKGFITFAAGESRKSRAQPDRRESDETVQ